MISIEECKKYLGGHLTDQQIENLRDTLYALVEPLLDDYINSCRIEPTCKKLSSTAEFHLNDKAKKDTA